MRKKTMTIILFCILIGVQALARVNPSGNVHVKYIDEAMLKNLIGNQIGNIKLKNVGKGQKIRPDKQSFEITIKSQTFYIVSINRDSDNGNSTTCSVLLFDKSGAIKSALDTAGPDHESRFWACDYVEAMSFNDYYSDGALKIIAVYYATPPSNERFLLPVILKFDSNKPSLTIDEALTLKLEEADVDTIKEVRAYLKKHEKKPD